MGAPMLLPEYLDALIDLTRRGRCTWTRGDLDESWVLAAPEGSLTLVARPRTPIELQFRLRGKVQEVGTFTDWPNGPLTALLAAVRLTSLGPVPPTAVRLLARAMEPA